MCQHPYIIRLLDIFENQDYIHIVMENLCGGDLFTYLEKRKFTIPESRAKVIAHQISTALYYLHSFGVAHRDLKPENILMAENTDNTDLKIVDFGLSKIIGPNETSLDPFGTLVSSTFTFIIY
jgi:serine/threonine protein kinase